MALLSSEEVRSVPEKLANFKANKRYLQATELLKNNGRSITTCCQACMSMSPPVARLDGELSSVEALKELRVELLQQKEVKFG